MTLSEKEIYQIQDKKELKNLRKYIRFFRDVIYYSTLSLLVILFINYI